MVAPMAAGLRNILNGSPSAKFNGRSLFRR
jgi:hypothetical protein